MTALSPMIRGDDLDDFRESLKTGDYSRTEYLRTVLQEKLESEEDPLLRTGIKRTLFQEHVPFPDELIYDASVSAMLADGDDIWIGSRSGDIARYSLSERRWTVLVRGEESLAIRAVQSILAEGEHIWFLSYGSVVGVLFKETESFFRSSYTR